MFNVSVCVLMHSYNQYGCQWRLFLYEIEIENGMEHEIEEPNERYNL